MEEYRNMGNVYETMTPAERVARGRNAAHVSWENTPDRTSRTAKAREALEARFSNEEERREYYRAMALKSAETRRRNAEARSAQSVSVTDQAVELVDDDDDFVPLHVGPSSVLDVITRHSPDDHRVCLCGQQWTPKHLTQELYEDAYRNA